MTLYQQYEKKIERITLGFQDVHETNHNIILGANIIKESMATMVQEIGFRGFIDIPEGQALEINRSIVYVYRIVKRIASQTLPNIKDDIKN